MSSQLEAIAGYVWADHDRNPVDGPVFSGPERGTGATLRQAAAYGDLVQCAHCGGIYDTTTCRQTAFYPVYHRWKAPCCKRAVNDGPGRDYRPVLLWQAGAGEAAGDP